MLCSRQAIEFFANFVAYKAAVKISKGRHLRCGLKPCDGGTALNLRFLTVQIRRTTKDVIADTMLDCCAMRMTNDRGNSFFRNTEGNFRFIC
jgi:hypothetical protein